MKNLFLILVLFVIGCTSEEDFKREVDKIYQEVKAIPVSEQCQNLEGYKKLEKIEKRLGTNYYTEITEEKINFYFSQCEVIKKIAEEERIRKEEMNKVGLWKYNFYVDDFGDRTNDGYVMLRTMGKFSNTATSGSPLKIEMYLNEGLTDNPWFRLYEYAGNNPIRGIYSNSAYNTLRCKVRDKYDTEINFSLNQFQGQDSFSLSKGRNGVEIKSILRRSILGNLELKVYCYVQQTPSSTYFFKLDFQYFENALRKFQELKN